MPVLRIKKQNRVVVVRVLVQPQTRFMNKIWCTVCRMGVSTVAHVSAGWGQIWECQESCEGQTT